MLLYHVSVENDACMLYIIVYYVFICLGYVNVYFALPTQYHLYVSVRADIVYPVMTCVGVE